MIFMAEQACKTCRRLIKGDLCPTCKSNEVTKTWRGIIVIFDPANSDVAKESGIASPGKFAVKVK